MFTSLSLDQFRKLAKGGKRVAVFREFSSDLITPMTAQQALSQNGQELIMLESGEKIKGMGRYSHIGFKPIAEIRAYGNESKVQEGENHYIYEGDPFIILRELHEKYRCISERELIGFAGGTAGYAAYDAIRYIENLPDSHEDQRVMPDLFFQFFDQSITFDHYKGMVLIVKVVETGGDLEKTYGQAMEEIEAIYQKVLEPPTIQRRERRNVSLDVKVIPEEEPFKKMIEKGKEYIVKGDVFQVVLSRRFQVPLTITPVELYRSMRMITPSPYMFFFQQSDFILAGASPEKLVSLHGKELETIPLAGTRPRGGTEEEDRTLEEDLLSDQKELAEHMMLVDLGRNDLGIVSKPGSVIVKELAVVQRFSHVMHIASFVRGEIREECDAFDALRATFPAGTLTGAPKIRAMEIIDELEPFRRGPYGGAICFFDHKGDLESCIGIRMVVIQEGIATIQAGLGVVYDSDPQKEADESRHKVHGILEAIRAAEEGKI